MLSNERRSLSFHSVAVCLMTFSLKTTETLHCRRTTLSCAWRGQSAGSRFLFMFRFSSSSSTFLLCSPFLAGCFSVNHRAHGANADRAMKKDVIRLLSWADLAADGFRCR